MDWFSKLIFKPCKVDGGDANIVVEDRGTLENEFLQKVAYEDVDLFHLNGYECVAKVVKIYDADTVHCIFFINGKAFKFKVRLAKVDTAEKDSNDPAERLWALAAIQKLKELSDNKLLWLKCYKWDKYGRLLGELFSFDNTTSKRSNISINQKLINQGLGYEYDGGERQLFRDWAPWEAWLDYPDFRPSWKPQPVDKIGDPEVFETPIDGVDFQISSNIANRS